MKIFTIKKKLAIKIKIVYHAFIYNHNTYLFMHTIYNNFFNRLKIFVCKDDNNLNRKLRYFDERKCKAASSDERKSLTSRITITEQLYM